MKTEKPNPAEPRHLPAIPTQNESDMIPSIPDLDDLVAQSPISHFAPPKQVDTNFQFRTIHELEIEVIKKSGTQSHVHNPISIPGLDLSVLTKHLVTNPDLIELDEVWDWETEFKKVTSKQC